MLFFEWNDSLNILYSNYKLKITWIRMGKIFIIKTILIIPINVSLLEGNFFLRIEISYTISQSRFPFLCIIEICMQIKK
jgi:hypothetical protein